MNNEDSTALKLWKITGYLASIPASIFLSGYTIQTLWQWFVVGFFHIPLLGFAQALGLALFVSYFTNRPKYYVEREGADNLRVIHSVVKPLLVLAVGWVIHSYM